MTPYDAIVLAGGGSTRLGTDKTRVVIDGTPVLERVLSAVSTAQARLVVGPERPVADDSGIRWLREDPPGTGPANGIACAASHLSAEFAVVLAGDLPYVDAATAHRLLAAAEANAGAVLYDQSGRAQWLSAAVRSDMLRDRLATRDSWANAAMQDLFAPLDLVGVPARGDESHDIDAPEDIPSQP